MKLDIMKLSFIFVSKQMASEKKSYSVEKGTVLKPRNQLYYLDIS